MSQSDSYLNTISDQDYLQQKIENLKMAFEKQDKNLDGEIDQNELMDFLDSNCKSKKFDRNLAKNIFFILDLDKNGKISKEEFI
jgi:Ca2+-binding EF-hand superfamily protein